MVFGKKRIIPVPKEPPENPYATANFFSKITYSWENTLFRIGFNRPLQKNDLYPLTPKFREENNEKQFYHYWNDEIPDQSNRYNLMKCLWKVFKRDYYIAGVLRLLTDISNLFTPVILEFLLNFLETSNSASAARMDEPEPSLQAQPGQEPSFRERIEPYMGWIYIAGIFMFQLIYTLCNNYYSKIVLEVGLSVRATIIGMIYHKTLKLSNKDLQTIGQGKIVNMVSTDSFRIQQFIN